MDGTTFASDMSYAAELARVNCRHGLLVHIELDKHGFMVVARAKSTHHQVEREYKQMVSWLDAELTDGMALREKIRTVVEGLRGEFVDIDRKQKE